MTQIVDTGTMQPAQAPAPEGQGTGAFRTFVRQLMRSKTGFLGFCVFALMVLICLIGPMFTPNDLPTNTNLIYGPASWSHPFGFDSEGRDVLIQVIDGGRAVILVGFLAALISTVIAVVFGALAAYLGGRVDSIIVTATDIVLTVPSIILLAVLAAFYRVGDSITLAVILGVLGWPGLLRAVRAQVFSLKQREYIEAARLLDLGTGRIVIREILPNMASFILMNFVIGMTNAIYAMAGLYLLGLAPMQGDNWGIMINFAWTRGAIFFDGSLGYILGPVLSICILQLSLVTMARSFEEILNPRLRHN
ncbi:ABC transporter permease [Actinopolymorpha sp. NPDC004070]|uniref:ABC transporter permease n=1 Tax=Actinopolymorpha sp. NPDC004070 TaxID=3154548 RepID=UPI0033B6CC20